jgi:4-diphosphocytidyl-2-C-methyl-D-erythritol kinase
VSDPGARARARDRAQRDSSVLGGRSVRVTAPAKINLGLRILGELKDGTHSVETLYQSIDLFDDVELALGEQGVRLTLHGPRRAGIPEGQDNLAVRAAAAFLEVVRSDAGAEIRLTKRIPHAAGLGGGSSDAAAVLLGLAALLDPTHAQVELPALAAKLGADVPFFLRGGTAFGYHRGSHLLALPPLPPLPALVVVPDVEISTFWAFHTWDVQRRGREPEAPAQPLRCDPALEDLALARNDFEPLVFEKFPEVESVHRTLQEGRPAVTRLSGTGAACYALYRTAAQRDAEAERLADLYRNRPDYGIFRVRLFEGGVRVV